MPTKHFYFFNLLGYCFKGDSFNIVFKRKQVTHLVYYLGKPIGHLVKVTEFTGKSFWPMDMLKKKGGGTSRSC